MCCQNLYLTKPHNKLGKLASSTLEQGYSIKFQEVRSLYYLPSRGPANSFLNN